jgi:mono/diheme cytochrome c family protein
VFAVLSYPARPPSAAEGQLIFHSDCSRCHGEDGAGSVPGSRNFRDLDYIRSETPADFYTAITEGRGDMPGYRDQLSSDERWDAVFYIWRLSSSAQTLSEGKLAYERNCASCHGEDGSGELLGSADFTDLRQMDELAPRDLYLTVTQGRGSMPAWQSLLNVEDRWAVIDYLRSFTYDPTLEFEVAAAGTEAATPSAGPSTCSVDQSNPLAWDDSNVIQAGQALYLVQCAMCHGPDGSGGLPQTPDFTSAEVNVTLTTEPGRFFCSVSEGKGVMPAFGSALTEDERWQVLTYMGSLGP